MNFRILLPLLIFLNCWGYDRKQEEKEKMDSLKLGSIITWYEMFAAPKPQSFVKDLNNGMVAYGSSYLGKDSYSFFLKKCFQGQIYRSSFNDCKGTGDASNNYGAQLLQFCDKTDVSCVQEAPLYYLNGNGNSEVYLSCSKEILYYSSYMKSSKWTVIDTTYEIGKVIEYKMDQTLYPSPQSEILFWIGRIKSDYSAPYTNFQTGIITMYPTDLQINRRSVLCVNYN